jgi:hypothetical protein
MKKNPTKLLKTLRLRKEVLKTLSTDQLVRVAGGDWEGYDSFVCTAGCTGGGGGDTIGDTIIIVE